MKKTLLLIPALLMLLLAGCLKDDPNQGTIVLLGTESDVKPIDEEHGGVIPDTLLTFLADSMKIELPRGCTPPDIQGGYAFCPKELIGGQSNGDDNDTVFIHFGGKAEILPNGDVYYPEGQHNCLVPCVIKYEERFHEKSVQAYVMGEGDGFTAYFKVDYEDAYPHGTNPDGSEILVEYTFTRGYVITGRITSEGIEDAKMAFVNAEVSTIISEKWHQISVYGVIPEEGQQHGVAKRYQWYQN